MSMKQNNHEIRTVFDVPNETNKKREELLDNVIESNSQEKEEIIQCECCEMMEECTVDYIERVKSCNCGKWVCGMCSEAVKERASRNFGSSMEEALSSHYEVYRKFNKTTRLNPKLSLATTMIDIARRSSQERYNTFTKKMKSSKMLKNAQSI
ncbi:uncharacterized protein LOC113351492 [Papaver somniferum]|uniref:uncharacterized protein LOC113351492 n=1 Tax=Papaver somniferum TaxID=3469 RepID=UPI000E703897|nr:uncharacterized protein LOC113351492 [Papaver somniferum]